MEMVSAHACASLTRAAWALPPRSAVVTARALLDMPDSRITCDDSGEVSMAYARRKSASWIKCCQDCPQRVGTTMAVSTRTIRCAS